MRGSIAPYQYKGIYVHIHLKDKIKIICSANKVVVNCCIGHVTHDSSTVENKLMFVLSVQENRSNIDNSTKIQYYA